VLDHRVRREVGTDPLHPAFAGPPAALLLRLVGHAFGPSLAEADAVAKPPTPQRRRAGRPRRPPPARPPLERRARPHTAPRPHRSRAAAALCAPRSLLLPPLPAPPP